MDAYLLVYPMFAMVVLSALALVTLFRRRVAAVRAGAVRSSFYREYRGATEPDRSHVAARHFANLFEAPTLFYAGCLAAMVTGDSTSLVLALAWLYVVLRAVHSAIHLGGNRLRYRIRAFFLSWLVLIGLWLHVVMHVHG